MQIYAHEIYNSEKRIVRRVKREVKKMLDDFENNIIGCQNIDKEQEKEEIDSTLEKLKYLLELSLTHSSDRNLVDSVVNEMISFKEKRLTRR